MPTAWWGGGSRAARGWRGWDRREGLFSGTSGRNLKVFPPLGLTTFRLPFSTFWGLLFSEETQT